MQSNDSSLPISYHFDVMLLRENVSRELCQ